MTKEQAINLLIAYGEENIIARTDVGIAFRMAIKSLEEERPKGKWIEDRDTYKCSNCGFGYFPANYFFQDGVCISDLKNRFAFKTCPNCGADMRGSEVEE